MMAHLRLLWQCQAEQLYAADHGVRGAISFGALQVLGFLSDEFVAVLCPPMKLPNHQIHTTNQSGTNNRRAVAKSKQDIFVALAAPHFYHYPRHEDFNALKTNARSL
jgi:hypothetical protein